MKNADWEMIVRALQEKADTALYVDGDPAAAKQWGELRDRALAFQVTLVGVKASALHVHDILGSLQRIATELGGAAQRLGTPSRPGRDKQHG